MPQAAALVGRSERSMYRAVRGDLADITVSITGGDLRVAIASLLRRFGLTLAAGGR